MATVIYKNTMSIQKRYILNCYLIKTKHIQIKLYYKKNEITESRIL